MINIDELIELTEMICKIPAPSNHEEKRAQFCKNYFEDFGATDVYIDCALNVVVPYCLDKFHDIAVLMAHTDTVFPDTEPFKTKIDTGKMYCPGIADDTTNLAFLMLLAKNIIKNNLIPKCGILFVANSGEEGLGNLKGVRKIMETYGKRTKEFITFDGTTDHIVTTSVGSHRYKLEVKSEGGHSFGAFGNENAIHKISEIVCDLYSIQIPHVASSKTTYNVGTISGGTSINTIAENAEITYEYRSDYPECLSYMKEKFENVIKKHADRGVDINVSVIGERPCGGDVDKKYHRAMIEYCKKIMSDTSSCEIIEESGSTDCNIPLSIGIPSVCFGILNGKGQHTRGEYIDLASLPKGAEAGEKIVMRYFN